jgi:hypothetical protein
MHHLFRPLLALLVLGTASTLPAQWPAVPTTNLAVAAAAGEQALPRIAASRDGGCYVAWFDQRGGGYAVWAQRLDGHGVPQWPGGGVLVSSHAQNTSLVGWDLIADRDDHCVLVFTDVRSGPDLDVYAYRLSPAGAQVWGGNGVAVSSNTDAEANPVVCEASDGAFVIAWPNTTQRTIQHQRFDRSGAPRFPGDGIAELGDQGSVIAVWVRALAFTAQKHLHMQKWTPTGAPAWNGGTRLPVFDLASVPIAHEPRLVPDGQGGAVVAWHFAQGNQFSARVQHVLANGSEAFAHDGVDLSTNGNSRFDPAPVWLPATQEILALYNERNPAQSQWGISAQLVDAAGQRGFGPAGLAVIPVGATERQAPAAVRSFAGASAVVFEALPTPSHAKVLGLRVDRSGALTFGAGVDVSTAAGPKLRLVASGTDGGSLLAAWSDRRSDAGDVYAQNLDLDGALGDRLATVLEYGCGTNPPGSLTFAGRPAVGTTMSFGVDNPLGTQAPGALAVLAFGLLPAIAFPCGALLPGFGMAGPLGELLLAQSAIAWTPIGGPWLGAGVPVPFQLALPPDAGLFGVGIFAQGLMLDLQPAAVTPRGFTTAVRLTIGS